MISKRWCEFSGGTTFCYPLFTSILLPFYLFLTSFLPFSNLNLTSASSRISNHGLETMVYRLLERPTISKKRTASKKTSPPPELVYQTEVLGTWCWFFLDKTIKHRVHYFFFRSQRKNPKAKKSHQQHQTFSEQFEGVTGHYPLKQGFWGKSQQGATRWGPTGPRASERKIFLREGLRKDLWKPLRAWNLCRKSSLAYLKVLCLRKLLPGTGVIWAFWAQSWKRSPKMSSRGLSAPGPKKSKTESKKPKLTIFQLCWLFSTPFSTFWAPGLRGLGNSFSDSCSKAPNDPCSRARECQFSVPDFFVQTLKIQWQGWKTQTGPTVADVEQSRGLRFDDHESEMPDADFREAMARSLHETRHVNKSWFSGRGWGQQLFSFQSPAVHWIARTSSLNCLSCRNPYQAPNSLNCLPPFHWKALFFTEKRFVASPCQNSALTWPIWNSHFWGCYGIRRSRRPYATAEGSLNADTPNTQSEGEGSVIPNRPPMLFPGSQALPPLVPRPMTIDDCLQRNYYQINSGMGRPKSLVTRPKYPPLSRDRCSNTPVALCFLWYRRLSLLYPHFSPYKWPIAVQRQA